VVHADIQPADSDPCATADNGGCDENAVCQAASDGGVECFCVRGFEGNGKYCKGAVRVYVPV